MAERQTVVQAGSSAVFVLEVCRPLFAQGMPAADEYATNTDLEGQIEHVRPIHVFDGDMNCFIS